MVIFQIYFEKLKDHMWVRKKKEKNQGSLWGLCPEKLDG